MILWSILGCVNLDALVHNPVHCSTVSEDTCEGIDEPFDRVCVPCDEPYDWGRDYDWIAGTLEAGQTIRAIDASLVTPVPIATADGEATLDAYFLESHGEDAGTAGVTLVYNHGRYAGIEHYLPRLRFLHEAGYNVFVWDYRGYGKSDPDVAPTSEQWLVDAAQVLEVARGEAPDPGRLIPYGYSVGATPATAMLDEVCALVLEAPQPSLSDAAEFGTRLSLPEQFLTSGRLSNYERLEAFDGPVLGMIGTEDEVVAGPDVQEPFIESGSGPAELWVVEGASHGIAGGGIPEDAGVTAYLDRLRSFVDEHCPSP